MKWSLRRSEIFKSKGGFDECKLVSLGELILFEDGEVICEAESQDDQLYICLEGRIN